MPPRSKLECAPDEVLAKIRELHRRGVNYKTICAKLDELGTETSPAALSRFMTREKKTMQQVAAVSKAAQLLADRLEDNLDGARMSSAARQMLTTVLYQFLSRSLGGDDSLDIKQVTALATALKNISLANKLDVGAEGGRRNLAEAGEKLEQMAEEAGLSDKTVSWIKKEALGL